MPRLPEVVPRRQGASTFAQIAAAVLSGAAAMYGIQSYQVPARQSMTANASPEGRQDRVVATPRPTLSEPLPVPPVPKLAPSSMLVKKEPGGAPQGVLAGGIDEPERGPGAASGPARLSPKPFASGFGAQSLGSEGIGRGFHRTEFRPMFTPQTRSASGKRSTRLIGKTPLDPKDLVVPSGFRPEDVPEPPFWSEERFQRVAGSALIALIGLCYLIFTSGAFAALSGKGRPRDGEEGAA